MTTPSPWQYLPGIDNNDDDADNVLGSIAGPLDPATGTRFLLARVWDDTPTPEADARLMAAAPEMLLVLAALVRWPGDATAFAAIRDAAAAAIAKAGGDDARGEPA